MDSSFEFTCGALALLGREFHVLANIPGVCGNKSASLVRNPFHAKKLPIGCIPTTQKVAGSGTRVGWGGRAFRGEG